MKRTTLFILLMSTMLLFGCGSTEPETTDLDTPATEEPVEETVEETEESLEDIVEPEETIEPTEEIEEKSFDDFEPWTLEEMLSLTFEERCTMTDEQSQEYHRMLDVKVVENNPDRMASIGKSFTDFESWTLEELQNISDDDLNAMTEEEYNNFCDVRGAKEIQYYKEKEAARKAEQPQAQTPPRDPNAVYATGDEVTPLPPEFEYEEDSGIH